MASLQAQGDAVKSAVSTHSTCTPTTVVTLKKLLGLETDTTAKTTKPGHRATKSTSAAKAKQEEGLGAKDKAALATNLINLTIKSLTEAQKQPLPAPEATEENNDATRAEKRGLRRSMSQPLTPLPSRTLNRTATSPNIASKTQKPTAVVSQATKYSATAECARVALASLRNARGPITADQDSFSVESAMWTLVGKLLNIGLYELAFKELRVLKRRLEKGPGSEPTTTDAAVCDLLDFKELISPHSLSTVSACQIQSLRLIGFWKKPAQIEGVLPLLRDTNKMSPSNIIAQDTGTDKTKLARQIALLSHALFDLAPGISSKDDSTALEPRLNPSPAVAFELQGLAFKAQFAHWQLTEAKDRAVETMLESFSRCVKCFARRAPADGSTFGLLSTVYTEIKSLLDAGDYTIANTPSSPIATIFQCLGAAAHTAQNYEAACEWYTALINLRTTESGTSVWACSVNARLIAAGLKRPTREESDERLMEDVIQGMNTSLSGTSSEVNELLESLSLARRSVAGMLMSNWNDTSAIPTTLRSLLQKFLLQYPRFVLRWLGSHPGKDASAKHILQFEQRCQHIMQSISQTLDGTLMIIKDQAASLSVFDMMDSVLQDCLTLVTDLADPTLPSSKLDTLGAYKVKISYLYFTIYSYGRKSSDQTKAKKKQFLQALSRSIDAVENCSPAEKEKANLATKQEIMAEQCRGAGRTDDASKTLRSICTRMVEEGVLETITTLLHSEPPRYAWGSSEKGLTLSRTLKSIAKIDDTWNDWTFFMPEAERAAVLEHLLQITTEDKSQNKPLQLHHPGMNGLLRIYSPDKYPVRRLRVLLKLYPQQLGQVDQLRGITTLLDQAVRHIQKKNLGEDAGLAKYIPHLQTYHRSIVALGAMDEVFPAATIREAVSTWTAMINSCISPRELTSKIDEPDALLEHLIGANQLAGMKGESHLQLSILELCLKLAKVHSEVTSDDLLAYECKLARQYIDVGLFTEAWQTLENVRSLIKADGLLADTVDDFYLSQAEYLAGIDKTSEALTCISRLTESGTSKNRPTLAIAQASLVHSNLLLRAGDVSGALRAARFTVGSLSSAWLKNDGMPLQPSVPVEKTLAESVLGAAYPKPPPEPFGVNLWPLARPLFDGVMHLSSVYAHIGAFQETMYYCDTAGRIANGSQSSLFKAEYSAWAASIYAKAGQSKEATEKLGDAIANMPKEACAARIKLARQIGQAYRGLDDEVKALEYFTMAEDTTRLLAKRGEPTQEEVKPAPTTRITQVKKPTAAATRRAAPTRTTRARAATTTVTTTTRAPRKTVATEAKAAPAPIPSVPKDIYQASLLASILLARAMGALQTKDWQSVASALELVKELPKFLDNMRQEQLLTATRHISLSLEQMVNDPVFSIMHDSTISFPAILTSTEKERRLSTGQSPLRKGRANTIKKAEAPAFVAALKQAQEVLLEAHASALTTGDNATMHRVSTLLQSTVISLTAASSPKIKTSIQCEATTVAVELARNAAWRREQQSMEVTNNSAQIARPQADDALVGGLSEQMAELGLTSDMARFQNDFIELVPKAWNVISLSLSENQHDLCITKFQAGHSPFILRLPLERINARDADSGVFTFEHGRAEMMEIIEGAYHTSHSGSGLTTKAEQRGWWEERAALDERLQELLLVIETTWLGGFKGIFSQHQRRPDLLARFQKSFHQMLERNLPSRSGGGRGKKKSLPSSVTLDPRILDLFIGLGDPTDPNEDFDEALNDLLYFVVDILQFHGERNAYDEIDFDGMVVETYDAMRGYYAELKADAGREEGAHTILVMDKALHSFPWESMPCLDGLPVSRVPSLAALRRLITEAKAPVNTMKDGLDNEQPAGHYVSPKVGTYFLNPSSDLVGTQTYFEPNFTTLSSWTGHINVKPEETHFESALSTSDILLYFGHGGGAQYIRSKTIRRLPKAKPATFLMGCSSAALTEAGEFEPYGSVWSYIASGCPAVVGTLWDVTDRDIDRFAGTAFEEWGLFDRGSFKDEKKAAWKTQRDAKKGEWGGTGSLVEAVGRARGVCRFRYLNAAAVVVYGIPVYIEKEG